MTKHITVGNPEGQISVVSVNVAGQFDELAEVGDFLARRISEPFEISQTFDPPILGGLVLLSGVRSLMLERGEQRGTTPCSNYDDPNAAKVGGVIIKPSLERANYNTPCRTVVQVGSKYDVLLDEGRSWIEVGCSNPARLLMRTLREHNLPADEITARLERATHCATLMVEAILNSDPNPPFGVATSPSS